MQIEDMPTSKALDLLKERLQDLEIDCVKKIDQ
jgi:hypothetical protein